MILHNLSITFVLEPHKTDIFDTMSRIFIVGYCTVYAMPTLCKEYCISSQNYNEIIRNTSPVI